MLGFGLGEIILIVVVAIIVLGPDKLPNALVEIVKTIRVIKKTINDAKETLDKEINIAELKREAQEYKDKLERSVSLDSIGYKEISEDIKEIKKDMNDVEHLFRDYKPRGVDIEDSSKVDSNEIKEESKEEPKDETQIITKHISDDSLKLYNEDNKEPENHRKLAEKYWSRKSKAE